MATRNLDSVLSSVSLTPFADVTSKSQTATPSIAMSSAWAIPDPSALAWANIPFLGARPISTVIGGSGDDLLDGGTAFDWMIGGPGNDRYIVDNKSDKITERPGEGIDTVVAYVDYGLSDNVENLTLIDNRPPVPRGHNPWPRLMGGGNASDNTLQASNLGSILWGMDGKDILFGGDGDDILDGGKGRDVLFGGKGWDSLEGGDGDDVLDGGTGPDYMGGGRGNDCYVVDSESDIVYEIFPDGIDVVESSVSFTLGDNVENLVLTGTAAALKGLGNSLDNSLKGNAGRNTLDGAAGSDYLSGLEGDDLLLGQAGDDTLDGGAGTDTLQGGIGNDVYLVGDRNELIIEDTNSGVDRIEASVSCTLSANVENLRFAVDSAGLEGIGNALSNELTASDRGSVLRGVDGNDTLVGGMGSDALYGGQGDDVLRDIPEGALPSSTYGLDTMVGGSGNDVYIVSNAKVTITEALNEGTDQVLSVVSFALSANFENLVLTGSTSGLMGTGNTLNNMLRANDSGNVLMGMQGDDSLIGGAGRDRLDGGAGNDFLDGRGGIKDELDGGAGGDTYFVGAQYGRVVIKETGTDGATDTLQFGTGVSFSQLKFSRQGDNLLIQSGPSASEVTVASWFSSVSSQIERIVTGDLVAISSYTVNTSLLSA